MLSHIPDWSTLPAVPKKLTQSSWRAENWRWKSLHSFISKKLRWSYQQCFSALISRLKSHIPVSSLFSLFLFYFSFVFSSLIFSNNLQSFIAQRSSFIRGKNNYCATEVIVWWGHTVVHMWRNCSEWRGCFSVPDIPLELLSDLAKKWLFKRKIHKCQRNL